MITTIIVNYKSHLLSIEAVNSVIADLPGGQIIVVDNSEDGQEAAALKARLPVNVELYISDRNIGFGCANNFAFEKSRYEWIFLLNPDARVLPGCLNQLQSFLESMPTAGAVSPMSFWDNACTWYLPPGQMPSPAMDFAIDLAMRSGYLGMKTSRGFRRWALHKLTSTGAKRLNMLSGGHVLLRKAAVRASGGLFDDKIFMYFEDTDLCRRLKYAGFGLYLLPSAQAIHSWQCHPGKAHLSEASHRYYLAKHFPNSRWNAARGFLHRHRRLQIPSSIDLGVLSGPVNLPVPQAWQAGWILEGSAHPLLIPAAYQIGKGPFATLSAEVLSFLGEGKYWLQLSPASDHSSSKDIQRFAFRIAQAVAAAQ